MITKIEIPFDSELQEQEIIFPEGFEARIEDGKIILRKKLSEGEKVRAWLIDTIKQVPNDSIEWETIDKSSVLSWLEKQGEQKELSQSQVTKTSDIDDDLDALEQAIYALESFVVEDKPNKCFAGHHVPFIKAIEKLKSLKERIAL